MMLCKRILATTILLVCGAAFFLSYHRPEFQRYILRALLIETTGSDTDGRKPSCLRTAETPCFIEVERGTLLYSVWFDDREVHNYIRILLMTWRRQNPPPLSCVFHSGTDANTSTSVASTYYEINKKYSKFRYGLFVVSCALQEELTTTLSFVEVSIKLSPEKRNNVVVLPVGNTKSQRRAVGTYRTEYGICVPPLHGNISAISFIEFLELSQILGASHFTFYDFETPDNVRKVLNYYEDKGLAQVLPWKLPSYIKEEDVHYFGQLFAIEDCLFRRMNDFKFLAFNDLDEFIVPLQYENMIFLLHSIHRDEHCGHCFKSANFPLSGGEAEFAWPLTQNVFARKQKADETRPKCVVDPQRVFEQGVHYIKNPLENKYIVDNVEWDVGRVFHYRECPKPFKEENFEVDNTMQRYGEELKQKIEKITDTIGLKPANSLVKRGASKPLTSKAKNDSEMIE